MNTSTRRTGICRTIRESSRPALSQHQWVRTHTAAMHNETAKNRQGVFVDPRLDQSTTSAASQGASETSSGKVRRTCKIRVRACNAQDLSTGKTQRRAPIKTGSMSWKCARRNQSLEHPAKVNKPSCTTKKTCIESPSRLEQRSKLAEVDPTTQNWETKTSFLAKSSTGTRTEFV